MPVTPVFDAPYVVDRPDDDVRYADCDLVITTWAAVDLGRPGPRHGPNDVTIIAVAGFHL